ncbi:MAG: alpha/beta fold hydrolase, partial [Candidatus Latescibacterota bacterium]
KPTFVLAHSLGGTIAALWAIQNPPDVTGIILSGAAIKISAKIPKILLILSNLLSKYLPRLPTIQFNNPQALSRDAHISTHHTQDPYIYRGRIPARTGAELLKGAHLAQQNLEKITRPVLILHGTQDTITDPQGSQDLQNRAQSQDKTLICYENLRHEILNEPERNRVLNDIETWMAQRI